MTATLVAIAGLLLLLAWFVWPRRHAPPGGFTPTRRPGVDHAELEAAEREVQEAPDAESVRDWGPGAQKPPRA